MSESACRVERQAARGVSSMAMTPTPEALATAQTTAERAVHTWEEAGVAHRAWYGRAQLIEVIRYELAAYAAEYAREIERATWEAALNELPSGSLFEHLRETFYARATARERSG